MTYEVGNNELSSAGAEDGNSPGEAMGVLLDVELPVSVSFGRATFR